MRDTFYDDVRLDHVAQDTPKRKWKDVALAFEGYFYPRTSPMANRVYFLDIKNVSDQPIVIEPGERLRLFKNKNAEYSNQPTYKLSKQEES